MLRTNGLQIVYTMLTIRAPQIVSRMLPMAYGTVYPITKTVLLASSRIAFSAAVHVPEPVIAPNRRAGFILKTYKPNSQVKI